MSILQKNVRKSLHLFSASILWLIYPIFLILQTIVVGVVIINNIFFIFSS